MYKVYINELDKILQVETLDFNKNIVTTDCGSIFYLTEDNFLLSSLDIQNYRLYDGDVFTVYYDNKEETLILTREGNGVFNFVREMFYEEKDDCSDSVFLGELGKGNIDSYQYVYYFEDLDFELMNNLASDKYTDVIIRVHGNVFENESLYKLIMD